MRVHLRCFATTARQARTVIAVGFAVAAATATGQSTPAPGGYIIEQDATVATAEPGPHAGGGQTTAYS